MAPSKRSPASGRGAASPTPEPSAPEPSAAGRGGRLRRLAARWPEALRPDPIGPRGLGLAGLSGALYFLGFIGFGIWPLIFVCFVPLLWALEGRSVGQALRLGWLAGAITSLGGFYWVVILIVQYGKLPTPVGILGWLLLAAYQGGRLGLVALAAQWLRPRLSPVWAFPLLLVAAEYGYPLLFPFNIGVALYAQPWLTQIADLTGVWGLSLLIGAVNVGVYAGLRQTGRRRWAPAAAAAAALLATIAYGAWRLPQVDAAAAAAPKLKVGLVQVNLGATEKLSEIQAFIAKHQQMTQRLAAARPDLDLIVWPETGYNDWIAKSRRDLRSVVPGVQQPVLFGALRYALRPGADPQRAASYDMFNSALLIDRDGVRIGDFDKTQPLLVGETLPFYVALKDVYTALMPGFAPLTPGDRYASLELPGKGRLLPMICYEDILPSFVRRMWRQGGPAELLVNITNDSWYGDTHEPQIHLAMASFRSVETHRAMVRATNTGRSALIDPAGRILKRTEQWQEALLVGEVPLIPGRQSTLYMRLGDWLPALCWLLLIGLALIHGQQLRRARRAASAAEAA